MTIHFDGYEVYGPPEYDCELCDGIGIIRNPRKKIWDRVFVDCPRCDGVGIEPPSPTDPIPPTFPPPPEAEVEK